jgi:hypothetical protein
MMKTNYSKNQRGVVTVLVVMALPVLLLIMGLALDFGHVFVNKTRLQNALDATALSAAIVINADVSKDITAQNNASDEGIKTFEQFKKSMGNDELNEVILLRTDFKYFATLPTLPPLPPPLNATDKFAFVKVTSTKNVIPWLIGIVDLIRGLPNKPIAVPATATAGPVGNICSLTPFVMCADMPADSTNLIPSDIDCDNDTIKIDTVSGHAVLGTDGINDCYGYNIGSIRSLELSCKEKFINGVSDLCPVNSLESGNYNLLNLDGMKGGKDIKCTLSLGLAPGCSKDPGYRNICALGEIVDTKPGYTWGDVKQGIDYRFESDTQITPYPLTEKIKGVDTPIIYASSPYTQYKTDNIVENSNRVMTTVLGDCRGLQKGSSNVPVVGAACVFLTEKAIQDGSSKKIMSEFTGASCLQGGTWNPENPVLNGPYKIVLFKSSESGDS